MTRSRWLAVLACVAAGACGGTSHVAVKNDVAITITPGDGDQLPFDPRAARLQSATAQVTALAGHPIAIQIDAAVASSLRADFERQLVAAMEEIARSLTVWKKEEPSAFPRTVAALRWIECRYRATVKEPSATFDPEAFVLRIDLGAHPAALVPRGVMFEAFADEDDRYRDREYGAKTPDSVQSTERRAYFDYLVRTRPGYGSLYERKFRDALRGLPSEEAFARSPRADVIVRVVRLYELAKGNDPELEAKSRAWLFEQLQYYFHEAYRRHAKALAGFDAKSPFRLAESAYARWLAGALPTASTTERLLAVRKMFDLDADRAYPGVDRFAFGLGIVDAWRRAGRPQTATADDPESKIFDEVVCPSVYDASGRSSRARSCSSASIGFLAFATRDAESCTRLARALDERDDADLARQLFTALRARPVRMRDDRDGTVVPYLEVLHGLDPKRRSFREGIDVLARDRDRALDAEGAYLWKAYPDERGRALLLLGQSKRDFGEHNGDDYWREFEKRFGASIDAKILGQMLDHGRIAFELVPKLWLGLERGFSRMDVLVPRLDALLPDAAAPEGMPVLRTLSAIVTRLCADRNGAADLAKLHSYLVQRTAARPSEAQALAILKRDAAPGGCKARTKKTTDDAEGND